MKSVLLSFLLLYTLTPAQPRPANLEIPITVYDNSGLPNSSITLIFGLDSAATDSIDPLLGEFWLYCPWNNPNPDCIPYDHFQAIFDLEVSSGNGFEWGTYKDFRNGLLPYSGLKEYKIVMGSYFSATAIYISWDFPEGVSGVLQDPVGGVLWNYQMPDSGAYTNPYFMTFNQTKLIITYDNAVPVELTSFKGTFKSTAVILDWSTASELNNKGFEIQRKTDNDYWTVVGFVDGAGTSSEIQNYTFIDKDISFIRSSTVLYRLKQFDLDGTFTYSGTITVEITRAPAVLLQNHPNPFNTATTIAFSLMDAAQVNLSVINILGERISELTDGYFQPGSYQFLFDASSLASGTYFYVLNAAGEIFTRRLIVVK